MKKRILLVVAVLLILAGIFLLVRVASSTLAPAGRGALQVTANVKASVILDGKSMGQVPLYLSDQDQIIAAGIHQLKIIPEDKSLSEASFKIDINPGVLTVVERTFLPGSLASSYILTLEKIGSTEPEIFISSIPDGALVAIDGDPKSVTPYKQTLSASEHEVEIDKPGFSKKTIRVRAVKSYRLVLNVALGVEPDADTTAPVISATPSAALTPTQTPVAAANSVIIKETPTGFLRVRANPSTGAAEIGRVTPGQSVEFVDENETWFQIKLENGTEGWISKTYAEKSTQ